MRRFFVTSAPLSSVVAIAALNSKRNMSSASNSNGIGNNGDSVTANAIEHRGGGGGGGGATNSSDSNNSNNTNTSMSVTTEAKALHEARRQAFLESQAEFNRIRQEQERAKQERLNRQKAQYSAVQSKTSVVSDVTVKRKKGPWGTFQLRDAWSSDAMSRHEKDSIDARLSSENRYNPFERDRRIAKIMVKAAIPSWLVGLGIAYYFITGKYPWQADYQHLLNILRQMDASPRSQLYVNRPDDQIPRDAQVGPNIGENGSDRRARFSQ